MRIIFLFTLLVSLELRAAYLGDISTTHSVTNLMALEALVVPDKTPVLLKGYYVEGDAPAVTYVFVAGDTSTVDNGSVITNAAGRFKIQTQGIVDPRWFGAVPDWSGDQMSVVFTNNSTTLTLTNTLPLTYINKKVAVRRGNTSKGATLFALVDVGGIVTNFVITNPGQGYIGVPTLNKVSGNGSGGTFTLNLTAGQVSSVTIGAGGTLYDTNTVWAVRAIDQGTTNAPYQSLVFTVNNQVGTSITLDSTPVWAAPINGTLDDPPVAVFYTDNTVAMSNALAYASSSGAKFWLPPGDWGTGPLYVASGQIVTGSGQNKGILHMIPQQTFSPFRHSVISPANIDFATGRHSTTNKIKDVVVSDLTIDGEGQWQNPFGTSFLNGNFALMGINCISVDNWRIERVTARNCQGDGIYFGSLTAPSGLGDDAVLVQSQHVKLDQCTLWSNWRNGGQFGNATFTTISSCLYTNNSYGYYLSKTVRNLLNTSPYSNEEIDMEANSSAASGYNRLVGNIFATDYGRALGIFIDQENTEIVGNTFFNCKEGAIVNDAASNTPIGGNNYDWSSEWTLIQGNRFICTTTNVTGGLVGIRHRGVRLLDNYFEGGTGAAAGLPCVSLDINGAMISSYIADGVMFKGNVFNLKANPGGSVGLIHLALPNSAAYPSYLAATTVRKLKWDNTIIEGIVDMKGVTPSEESDVEKFMAGSEPYVWQPTSAAANFKTVASTAGIGQSDFTITMKLGLNAAGVNNGELLRFTSSANEIRLFDKMAAPSSTNIFTVDWNPNNVGTRTINIPFTAYRNAFPSVHASQQVRPLNFSIVRRRGSVFAVTVTNPGSGYTVAPTVTFGGGGGTGASAFVQIDTGAGTVTNIWVAFGGSGFTGTTNPVVNFAGGGGGINAAATASTGRLEFWFDDELGWTDTGTDCITPMSTSAVSLQVLNSTGVNQTKLYSYAIWNKSLGALDLDKYFVYGPATGDKWGAWGGAVGCLTYVKLDAGLGWFFEDKSSNLMDLWGAADMNHSQPKRSGQFLRTISVTAAAGATNGINASSSTANCIPSNARITSAYVVPKSGAAPTIRIGFDSAITDQLVAPVTLTANTTNYLSLVPTMVYGSTNRPIYIGQTGAATNDIVINYSLDQGGLDGSTIQSGIVTAPGGLGSTSPIAATAIDATGWTNTFGVNAMVYAEGTGLQFTVYNAAGTPVYTNAATVGSASIALQKGAKMIVIAGTGVSGRAVPW